MERDERSLGPEPADWGLVWTQCLLVFCLPLLSGSAPGVHTPCSEFYSTSPSSPALRLLSFTAGRGPCGSPYQFPADLPGLPWRPDVPTVVIVPGRRPPRRQPSWVGMMAGELLALGGSNILAVDWLAAPEQEITDGASQIGKRLAQVIQDEGSAPEMFHLIGFGVGAQVAGVAGRYQHGTIGRIIANEPLAALGFSKAVGHVDFYIGQGYQLPGCPIGLMEREQYLLCSHHRAIFTSSIQAPCPLVAFPCRSLEDFQRALCTHCLLPGLSVCPRLGYDISWLPVERPVLFQHVTALLDITATPPFCG